jgi:hypothetical protein
LIFLRNSGRCFVFALSRGKTESLHKVIRLTKRRLKNINTKIKHITQDGDQAPGAAQQALLRKGSVYSQAKKGQTLLLLR